MPIADVCNRDVIFAQKQNTVLEAAQIMRQHHVGNLVVVESSNGHRVPIGIVTDRDIVIEVVAKDLRPRNFTVGDIMSQEMITANECDGIYETIQLMRIKGVRRLPVVNDQGHLLGIVAMDDLLTLLAGELTELAGVTPRERATEAASRR